MPSRGNVMCFFIGALTTTFLTSFFSSCAMGGGRVSTCPACPTLSQVPVLPPLKSQQPLAMQQKQLLPPQPVPAPPSPVQLAALLHDADQQAQIPPPVLPPPPPPPLPPPPPPQAAATPSAAPPHIVFGMNTIPRRSGEEYITRTLGSLKEHIASDVGKIQAAPRSSVLVLDPRGNEGANRPFASNKATYANDLGFHFVSKMGTKDPFQGHQEPRDPNQSDIPGSVGRQHTCDIVTLLETVLEKFPTCDYFMFMEDDFTMCDSGYEAIWHAIGKSNSYSPDWAGLRVSYGLNGIVVPCKDLPAMKKFMFDKSAWRPADLLAVYQQPHRPLHQPFHAPPSVQPPLLQAPHGQAGLGPLIFD
jgi:hypothetical protein